MDSYNKWNILHKNSPNKTEKKIWFNPTYNKNVKPNISKGFMKLIEKHFPKQNTLAKIFNKNIEIS